MENRWNLFIGDLDSSVNDSDLWDAFSNYQSLVNARVVLDFETKKSKGYGFLSFASEEEAERVLQEMNKLKIKAREIRLNWAVQKVTRSNTFSKIYNATPEYNCTIYISNYPDTYLDQLSEVFGEFGYVIDIKVYDGFSFVTMDSHHAAALSIMHLNGTLVDGTRLKVAWGKHRFTWESPILVPYPYVYQVPFPNPIMVPFVNMNGQIRYQENQNNQQDQ